MAGAEFGELCKKALLLRGSAGRWVTLRFKAGCVGLLIDATSEEARSGVDRYAFMIPAVSVDVLLCSIRTHPN